jgi:predicted metal-dependent HD superfamily phosphohydrolase
MSNEEVIHLERIFRENCRPFTSQEDRISAAWQKIKIGYCARGRYYHTLDHLAALFNQLDEVKGLIQDYVATVFATFYHDIVYSVVRGNNEEKSADLASRELKSLQIPLSIQNKVSELILATKTHAISGVGDVNIFTDADLSVLGSSAEMYGLYVQQIRKEYNVMPDLLYKPGRRKVLEHFLAMPFIFKTPYFRSKFETSARDNIHTELKNLN